MGQTTEGQLDGRGLRIAISVSRFNGAFTQRLLEGAVDRLTRLGVAENDIDVVRVPGAYELPQAVKALMKKGEYDGILPLGCIIRGETPHFDYLCQAVTMGLARLALEGDVPMVNGVLTVETAEQAYQRSGLKADRGAEAAESLVELIDALRSVSG